MRPFVIKWPTPLQRTEESQPLATMLFTIGSFYENMGLLLKTGLVDKDLALEYIVREVERGRGSFDFDYRVYARSNEPETNAASAEPNAPMVRTPAETKVLSAPVRPRP